MLFEKPILILVSRLQQFLEEARPKFILIAFFPARGTETQSVRKQCEKTRPRWHIYDTLIQGKTTLRTSPADTLPKGL
jgi:hypothetical protein